MAHNQQVFVYGSAEIDQFEPREEDNPLQKRLIEIMFFKDNGLIISQVVCGALHTLVLTNQGTVYSWGSNDEFALGRRAENKNVPGMVMLDHRVNAISAGHSHSIACNKNNGLVYFWGSYRSEIRGVIFKFLGRFYGPIESAIIVGQNSFKGKTIQKIISGENHAMVLCGQKVFVWGDPETGCLGRKPVERRKFLQCIQVEGLHFKNVTDIYTGSNHSFCRTEKNSVIKYYAWGLNNWGQLGIGTRSQDDVLNLGAEVQFFRNQQVVNMEGGSHHTIALVRNGEGSLVFGFGRNDDGQLGVGCADPEYQMTFEQRIRAINNKYFDSPQLICLKDIQKVSSSGSYSYAIDKSSLTYSWGLGHNFGLGNLKEMESNEIAPFKIPPKFFKDLKPFSINLGSKHVVVLVQDKEVKTDAGIDEINIFQKQTQQNVKQSIKKLRGNHEIEGQSLMATKGKINQGLDEINEICIGDNNQKRELQLNLRQNLECLHFHDLLHDSISDQTTPRFITTPGFSDAKNQKIMQWDCKNDFELQDVKKRL